MNSKLLIAPILFISFLTFSQDSVSDYSREDALDIFIDCDFCDMNYVKNKINYVNYVRDTKAAQVHVITTSQRTGSGGTEYTFNFIGQLDFEGQNDTVSVVTRADATSHERRELRTKFLMIGLMQYVAKTPLVDFITIDYTNDEDSSNTDVKDKWNLWVFRISANGWFNGQELYKSRNMNSSISANRITEKWKIENWGNFGYNESKYQIDDTTSITNSNQNWYVESSAVRAINDHWSVGAVGSINSSTFSNIKLKYRVTPAIEYDVFKYADFNRKQIRFQYRVGYDNMQYVDTTIYNKLDEHLFNHKLSMAAEFTQKWGSLFFSTTASQYLHDPSLRRLTLSGRISWRILKGLSVNANGNLNFIQDQIALPKGGATDVEILTQQKQLATQYSYWGSVGLSYTFGSIYNNIVNPRFGN
mgnify:CR=1 FL=1